MPKVDNNIIKVILQTGGIGLALTSMWMFYKLSTNGLEHSTAALIRLESTISQFSEVEKQQTEVLKDLKLIIQSLR